MSTFSFTKFNNKRVVVSLLFSALLITGCSTGSDPIDNHTHNFVVEKGVQPTCTEDGTTSKVYCSECGYVLTDHEVVKALGHSVVEMPEKEPGIQYDGNNAYSCCERCGELFSEKTNTGRLLVKNEVWSHTHDNNIDFKLMIHKNDLDYRTSITVEHLDVEESFELENEDQFTYEDMLSDTLYTFTFNTQYDDGDYEDELVLTRYINTADPHIPVINIETKDYEWPSHRGVIAPEGCWGESQVDNNYLYCSFELNNADNSNIYHSSTTTENNYTARIKLRGNTSSFDEKAPYKIKLAEKADLLATPLSRTGKQYESKEWLLMNDNGFKTQLGFYLNHSLTQKNQLSGTHVNLYINGDYRGVYFLTESIQKGAVKSGKQSRVQIDNDGFIFEDDAYWWNEGLYFNTKLINCPTKYTFKYPESEDITDDQINYIKNIMVSFEETLLVEGDDYLDYIDVDSFTKWLLTHDILGTWDSGGSNIYLTKKDSADSKIEMGPCWDFDSIFMTNVEEHFRGMYEPHLYYTHLKKKNSFMERYCTLFDEVKSTVVSDCSNYLNSLDKSSIDNDNVINNTRWDKSGKTVDQFINEMQEYLSQRIDWIDTDLHSV